MGWSACFCIASFIGAGICLAWPKKRNPHNERTYGVLPPASEKCKREYPT